MNFSFILSLYPFFIFKITPKTVCNFVKWWDEEIGLILYSLNRDSLPKDIGTM